MTTTSAGPPDTFDPDIVYCTRHPDVETALRCSRCETPICPRCLIQTPVGARCKDCAAMRKNPIYTLSPDRYIRAGAVALLGGGVVGVLWALLSPGRIFPGLFSLAIAAGVGWLMAKGVERAVAYRRGQIVQGFAVAGCIIAFVVRSVLIYDGLSIDVFGLIALAVACYIAIQNLK